MSSFRKSLIAMVGLLVLLMTTAPVLAQPNPFLPAGGEAGPMNKSDLYGGRGGQSIQSRNIPAGTVVDPGSQVLYIVDTGVKYCRHRRESSGGSTGGFW